MEGVCGIVLHPERFLLLWLGFPGDKGWAAAPPGLALLWHWQGHLVWLFQLRAAVPIRPIVTSHGSGGCGALLNYT